MTGPKYPGVSDKNVYSPASEKVSGSIVMSGPKLPGVESKNQFNIVERKVMTMIMLLMVMKMMIIMM